MSFYAVTRARQFFHIKSSGGQSKQKDAHDDMPCKGRRDKAYPSFQNQSGQDSFNADEAQIRGENRRQEAFDRKSADFKSIFDTNQQRRKRLYRKADILREEIFQNNDNKREAVFQAGQTSRAAMYEKEETARVQVFERFCETRAWILIEGRQTREKSLNNIDATIRDRCESLLRAQEDRFLQKEHQRDTIVENLFAAQLKPNLSSDGFLGSATQEIPSKLSLAAQRPPHKVPESGALEVPPLAANQRPQQGVHRPRWLPIPPPRPLPRPPPRFGLVPPVTYNPAHDTHVDETPIIRSIHCSPMPSGILPATEESKSSHSRSPLRRAPIDLSQSDARQQKRDNIPELEKSCGASQRRHSEDFVHEEELREERVQSVESERDRAESERSRLFEEQELQRQDIFQVMLNMQGNYYLSREETRADVADQREEFFLISQDRHEQAFNISIEDIENRMQIEDSFEEFLDKKLRHRVEVTVIQQNDRLKAAADDQRTRFYTAELRRRTQLGVILPCLDSNQEPRMEPRMEPLALSARRVVSPIGLYVNPSRYPTSPPTGFAVNVLFKDANTSNPLPIPNTKKDPGFETIQSRHEILFKRSQSRREPGFQQGMERHKHIFNVNEQRRALDFEKKQRSRQAIFEENEDKRERCFIEAQHQEEMRFLDAERLRGVSFRESERHRQRRFEVAQKERLQKLHGKLQELQLFVEEERRLEDLKIWSTRQLEECEKQGKGRFQADEAERDKSFHSMLSAACHNDIG